MSFLLNILTFIILMLNSNEAAVSTRSKSNDAAAKADITSLASALEMHYTRAGEYPTEKELIKEPDTSLPGVHKDLFYDADGAFINSGSYSYSPSACTALGCDHYLLRATLSDGTTFEKRSVR